LAKKLDAAYKEEVEEQKTRLIRAGGAQAKLSVEEQIVLTLIYRRQRVRFQILGLMFHVSESQANALFNYWQKFFRDLWPVGLNRLKLMGKTKRF